MTRLRLPLRIARRDVVRRPGRSALVALLVALPVAGMAMAVTIIRTDQLTLADDWAQHNGRADARGFAAEDLERLPEGATAVPLHTWSVAVRAVDGPRQVLELLDPTDLEPFAPVGPVVVDGRAPTSAGEITLTRETARRFDVDLGEELAIDRPVDATFTVVGLAEDPDCLSCSVGHATLDTLKALAPGSEEPAPERWLIDLPELSPAEQQALLEATAGRVLTRDQHLSGLGAPAAGNGGDDGVRWAYVLGAVALTVVGIVVSAAFAVGARRQLVTIGQLSASGASPSTVRAALVLQGTLTGVIGAVAGLAIAGGGLLGLRGAVEGVLDQRIPAYDVRTIELLAAALVGIGAATVAALIPARTAAKVPTLTALAGRRPLPPVPRRLIAWGMVAVVGGLSLLGVAVVGARSGESGQLWAFIAILGGVAELLGACAIAPAIVARLEPLAARLRGSWRMAARGLARHRTRTGAVVGAVCATAGFAIAASSLLQGAQARATGYLEPSPRVAVAAVRVSTETPLSAEEGGGFRYEEHTEPPAADVAARMQRILPSATPVMVREARSPVTEAGASRWWDVPSTEDGSAVATSAGLSTYPPADTGVMVFQSYPGLTVADDGVLDALELSDTEREALSEAGAVLLVPRRGGQETVAIQAGEEAGGAGGERRLPLVTVAVDHSVGSDVGGILVTEARAEDLGLEIHPLATMFVNPDPLDERQRDLLDDLAADVQRESAPVVVSEDASGELVEGGVESRWFELQVRRPPSGPTPLQLELALTGLALVFCLFVVGTSLALAAAESKDERDVLTVAGAPPQLLAQMAGARAWLLAGIGGLMAVPVGFLPVVVFTAAISEGGTAPYPLVFPLRTVALLVLAVPIVVALVARTSSAVAQRARPVRVSTAVFE